MIKSDESKIEKIGIITHYHGSVNYGGVLQAYALCRKLNSMGYDAKQISYPIFNEQSKSNIISKIKRNLQFKRLLFFIPKKIINFRDLRIRKRYFGNRIRLFEEFREKLVPHTELYTDDNIAECVDRFDAFITGSDQVWNPLWIRKGFYLDFNAGGKRKISYAASTGTNTFTVEQQEFLHEKLKDFYAVSVREDETQEIIEKITGKETEWVLDPTLLLSSEEWDTVCSENLVGRPYLLCYFLCKNKKVRRAAEFYAAQKNLTIVNIPTFAYADVDKTFGDFKAYDASPQDFISLIKYAEYVFTDSFHACAFSTVYKKQFYVFSLDNSIMISRINCILRMIGAQNRLVSEDAADSFFASENMQPIDYEISKVRMQKMKEKSEEFLRTNL